MQAAIALPLTVAATLYVSRPDFRQFVRRTFARGGSQLEDDQDLADEAYNLFAAIEVEAGYIAKGDRHYAQSCHNLRIDRAKRLVPFYIAMVKKYAKTEPALVEFSWKGLAAAMLEFTLALGDSNGNVAGKARAVLSYGDLDARLMGLDAEIQLLLGA